MALNPKASNFSSHGWLLLNLSGSDYNKNRASDTKDRRKEGIVINEILENLMWLGLMLSDMDQELIMYPEAYSTASFLKQSLF